MHITTVTFFTASNLPVDTLSFKTEKPSTMITSDLGDQVRKAWKYLEGRHGVTIKRAETV